MTWAIFNSGSPSLSMIIAVSVIVRRTAGLVFFFYLSKGMKCTGISEADGTVKQRIRAPAVVLCYMTDNPTYARAQVRASTENAAYNLVGY